MSVKHICALTYLGGSNKQSCTLSSKINVSCSKNNEDSGSIFTTVIWNEPCKHIIYFHVTSSPWYPRNIFCRERITSSWIKSGSFKLHAHNKSFRLKTSVYSPRKSLKIVGKEVRSMAVEHELLMIKLLKILFIKNWKKKVKIMQKPYLPLQLMKCELYGPGMVIQKKVLPNLIQ